MHVIFLPNPVPRKPNFSKDIYGIDFSLNFFRFNASLSRLQHLPIQTMKIDRSFINELDKPNSKGSCTPVPRLRLEEYISLMVNFYFQQCALTNIVQEIPLFLLLMPAILP